MSLQVGKAINNILSTDVDLHEKVGSKIYPLVAENGTTFPFIVYKRISVNPSDSKDRYIYQNTAIVEIAVVSNKYNESVEIAELVNKALQGKKGIFNNISISNIQFDDATEDFLEDSFIQTITYKIHTNNG